MNNLLTVDQWREVLAPTEGLGTLSVSMDGTGGLAVFSLPSGWNVGLKDMDDTDLTDGVLGVDNKEFRLTKGAVLGIASAVGLPANYVAKTPGPMIQSHLNYWASHSPDVALKFLTKHVGDHYEALAMAKQGITPFSNWDLLERALDAIEKHYEVSEDSVFVDFKSHHSLTVTNTRLIVPNDFRTMSSLRAQKTGVEDKWSAGVQVRNSLIGKYPLSAQGYLFAHACDNGMITYHAAGKYNRKTMGQDEYEVLDWTQNAVNDVIESMEHEFDTIESLTEENVGGDVSKVIADIFKTYKVPLKVRNTILDNLLGAEDYSYYGIVNAVTEAANGEELPEHFVTALLEIGGDIAHHAHERCENCKRVIA